MTAFRSWSTSLIFAVLTVCQNLTLQEKRGPELNATQDWWTKQLYSKISQINIKITYKLIVLPVTFLQQHVFYSVNCLFASSATLGHKFSFFCKESWPLSPTKRVHLDNINLYANNIASNCTYANTRDQVIANSHFFSFKTLEEW